VQMALGEGIDLVRPIDCARLSFHGGSCWAAFAWLVTGRIARPVRSRPFKISTTTGTTLAEKPVSLHVLNLGYGYGTGDKAVGCSPKDVRPCDRGKSQPKRLRPGTIGGPDRVDMTVPGDKKTPVVWRLQR